MAEKLQPVTHYRTWLDGRICGDLFPTRHYTTGSVDEVYAQAIALTRHVAQYDHVEIFYLGKCWGRLRGQC